MAYIGLLNKRYRCSGYIQCNLDNGNTDNENAYNRNFAQTMYFSSFSGILFIILKAVPWMEALKASGAAVKYLKKNKQTDQKDVKVDLLLVNDQLMDIFSCEDKPTDASEADIQTDIKKPKDFREKRLQFIQTLLPHPSNMKHVEVISAQFCGLTLTVYGSKMTENGIIIHYQKSSSTIPSTSSHMPQLAQFLLTVISLQRNVVLNLKKLEIICDASLQDSVDFLSPPLGGETCDVFFRGNSPASSQNSQSRSSNQDPTDQINWMEAEQSRRVTKLIDASMEGVTLGDDVLTCDDWENMLPSE